MNNRAYVYSFVKKFTFLFFFILGANFANAQTIFVDPVINSIKIGSLAGNRNLAFGVKNIVQELISDKDGYFLVEDKSKAEYTILVELIFFDIVNSNTGFAVIHKDKSTTVIRMKGILLKDGKKIKQEFSEGKSSEISTSTIIIDEGGKFNQESASSAIKKTVTSLIEKLL